MKCISYLDRTSCSMSSKGLQKVRYNLKPLSFDFKREQSPAVRLYTASVVQQK